MNPTKIKAKQPIKTIWNHALKVSSPIFFAYFPLGIVFGILFNHLGFNWVYAPIMSLLVYAGSVQFVALSFLMSHGSLVSMLVATLFVALRNSFYGLAFLERYDTKWYKKLFLIYGMVDATYALLVTHNDLPKKQDEKFCLYLTFLIMFYWVSGTFVGALFSQWLPQIPGLGFVLPCFFMVLVVEQYLKLRTFKPFFMAIIAAIIAFLIYPQQFLLLAICISIIFILLYYRGERSV